MTILTIFAIAGMVFGSLGGLAALVMGALSRTRRDFDAWSNLAVVSWSIALVAALFLICMEIFA